ncbi:MAG: hypothetical protein IPN67_00240 [Bacteroidales bacterium]|nr:hypothetical protein [Bacteroidales bacterium]
MINSFSPLLKASLLNGHGGIAEIPFETRSLAFHPSWTTGGSRDFGAPGSFAISNFRTGIIKLWFRHIHQARNWHFPAEIHRYLIHSSLSNVPDAI